LEAEDVPGRVPEDEGKNVVSKDVEIGCQWAPLSYSTLEWKGRSG
jgi:hypothetical protein